MSEEVQDVEFEETVETPKTEAPKEQGVPSFFNPLADEVKEREYNKQEDLTSMGGGVDLPEPDFNTAISEEPEIEAEPEPSVFDNITNEKVNQLDGKEKKLAVDSLVDTVLDGYEMLHGFAAEKAKIDEAEFQKHIMEGTIDPTIPLQTQTGEQASPVEMVEAYNGQVEELFEYDKEFNDKVREPMRRVFAKKGWGLTDEQYLMVQFGKDIATKSMMFFGMKKQSNQMMQMMASMTEQMARIKEEQEPSVTPDSVTTPPKQERPQQAEPMSEAEEVEAEFESEE